MPSRPIDMPSARDVVTHFERALDGGTPPLSGDVLGLLMALHRNNLAQWQKEDLTRAPGADDATVAAAKRDIDALNATRHHLVEARFDQRDFKLKPFSAMFGALKVQPVVQIQVRVPKA